MIAQQGKVYGRKFVVLSSDTAVSDSLNRVLLFAGATVYVSTTSEEALSLVFSQKPDLFIVYDPNNIFNLKHLHFCIASDVGARKTHRMIVTNQFVIDELRDSLQDSYTDLVPSQQFDIVHGVFRIETILKGENPKSETNSGMIDISEISKPVLNNSKALPVRVFVVEDDMLMRDLLITKFKKAGFEYNLFPSGEGAVEAIIDFKPSVVILDYTLPGKSGLDVLREIRNHPDLNLVEVIIFSNRDEESDKEAARALGVNKFLLKVATDLNDLINIIKEIVNR